MNAPALILALALLAASAAGADTFSGVLLRGAKAGVPTEGGGNASACTDGVDCLCDTLTTASTLLGCEDFEDAAFYDDVAHNWAATGTGHVCYRGGDSLWTNRFGSTGANFWTNGQPALPYIGCSCSVTSPAVCASPEYCSAAQGALTTAGVADCWGPGDANSKAPIDIQRAGDFDAEVGSLTLVNGKGAAADVGGGNQHFAHRIGPDSTNGIIGAMYLKAGGGGDANNNTNSTEVGITMALAYSPNILTETNSIIGYNGGSASAWKHDEWDDGQGVDEHWNLGNTGCGTVDDFPYRGIMFTNPPDGSVESACDASAASAVTVGNAYCNSVALQMCATDLYSISQSDSPIGRWVCHQAHIKGMNTSNLEVEIKHNGTTVFHMVGFDGTLLRTNYYDHFKFNAYANRNQGDSPAGQHTDVTQYRYEDSIVVVAGPPEPCSSIGF